MGHHHHHLICVNCEKTLPFDYCPMDRGLELPGNYKVLRHRFEVYGICESCQGSRMKNPWSKRQNTCYPFTSKHAFFRESMLAVGYANHAFIKLVMVSFTFFKP